MTNSLRISSPAGPGVITAEQVEATTVQNSEVQIAAPQVETVNVMSPAETSVIQPGPSATQAEPESTPVIPEVELAETRSSTPAEGSSSQIAPSTTLRDTIRALMADEDPERVVITAELEGFVVLLNSTIERVMNKGLSFSSFRRLFDRRVAIIREEGFSDLADSIAEDLARLEEELITFLKLRSTGASAYISPRIESIIKAREAERGTIEQELHHAQAQSAHIRANFHVKEKNRTDLIHSIKQQTLEVTRLREALKDAEETQSVLEADLAGMEKSCSMLADQMKASDEKSAKLEHKLIQLLTIDDASRALLEKELEQAYNNELSSLEEQIRCHQL